MMFLGIANKNGKGYPPKVSSINTMPKEVISIASLIQENTI